MPQVAMTTRHHDDAKDNSKSRRTLLGTLEETQGALDEALGQAGEIHGQIVPQEPRPGNKESAESYNSVDGRVRRIVEQARLLQSMLLEIRNAIQ